jgi:hypothetical protein
MPSRIEFQIGADRGENVGVRVRHSRHAQSHRGDRDKHHDNA